jgi:hypothetical protein
MYLLITLDSYGTTFKENNMKQYLHFILSLFLAVTSCQPAFALTKVDGSLLKGDVIGGTASNTRRIVVPKDTKANLDAKTRLEANLVYGTDTKKAYIDNGTDLIAVGSGSGGGAVNLITDGDAESATSSIFIPYLDSGSRPTDGTGAPGAGGTTAITSTSPLTALKSYLLTKPAGNYQGHGWSVPFTVDPSYRAKVLKISVDYIVNSGTFVAGSSSADSDVIWYLYDISNSTLIEPSSIKMLASSSTLSDKFEATFQTSATGASYRLIAHIATTSASAYELKVDNVTVSPSAYVYGTPITDWVSWTPTGSWTTNTTYTGKKRRVGDEYEYMVRVATSGAPTAANLIIQLQETIDTSKLNSTIQYASAFESSGQAYDSGIGHGVKVVYSSLATQVALTNVVGPQTLVSNTAPFTFGAGDEINVRFTLPILGKSASVQMSSDAGDSRAVVATARRITSAFAVGTAATKVQWNSNAKDTHGALDTTTNYRYTVPVAGRYQHSGAISFSATASFAQFYILLYKNGAAVKTQSGIGSATLISGSTFSFDEDANAGDYFEIYIQTTGAATTVLSDASIVGGSTWDIKRISGPQAIAANESINAVYTTAAGQSIPNATDTIIDFGTAEVNSHGNVTTGASWKFTARASGLYEVSCYVQLNSGGGWGVSEEAVVSIFKNASSFATVGLYAQTVVNTVAVSIPCSTRQVRLVDGDYIDIRLNQNSGAAITLVGSALRNWVSIKKVGN